jgi:hypothetical protein
MYIFQKIKRLRRFLPLFFRARKFCELEKGNSSLKKHGEGEIHLPQRGNFKSSFLPAGDEKYVRNKNN